MGYDPQTFPGATHEEAFSVLRKLGLRPQTTVIGLKAFAQVRRKGGEEDLLVRRINFPVAPMAQHLVVFYSYPLVDGISHMACAVWDKSEATLSVADSLAQPSPEWLLNVLRDGGIDWPICRRRTLQYRQQFQPASCSAWAVFNAWELLHSRVPAKPAGKIESDTLIRPWISKFEQTAEG